jgi:hypothetical protein
MVIDLAVVLEFHMVCADVTPKKTTAHQWEVYMCMETMRTLHAGVGVGALAPNRNDERALH